MRLLTNFCCLHFFVLSPTSKVKKVAKVATLFLNWILKAIKSMNCIYFSNLVLNIFFGWNSDWKAYFF